MSCLLELARIVMERDPPSRTGISKQRFRFRCYKSLKSTVRKMIDVVPFAAASNVAAPRTQLTRLGEDPADAPASSNAAALRVRHLKRGSFAPTGAL